MPASLADLIAAQRSRNATIEPWHGVNHPRSNFYQPEPEPDVPPPPQWLLDAIAKVADLSARCDALIARNGVWTRYETGGE